MFFILVILDKSIGSSIMIIEVLVILEAFEVIVVIVVHLCIEILRVACCDPAKSLAVVVLWF